MVEMFFPSLGETIEASPNLRRETVIPPSLLELKPSLRSPLIEADQCHLRKTGKQS